MQYARHVAYVAVGHVAFPCLLGLLLGFAWSCLVLLGLLLDTKARPAGIATGIIPKIPGLKYKTRFNTRGIIPAGIFGPSLVRVRRGRSNGLMRRNGNVV